jgi:hypothetical protein
MIFTLFRLFYLLIVGFMKTLEFSYNFIGGFLESFLDIGLDCINAEGPLAFRVLSTSFGFLCFFSFWVASSVLVISFLLVAPFIFVFIISVLVLSYLFSVFIWVIIGNLDRSLTFVGGTFVTYYSVEKFAFYCYLGAVASYFVLQIINSGILRRILSAVIDFIEMFDISLENNERLHSIRVYTGAVRCSPFMSGLTVTDRICTFEPTENSVEVPSLDWNDESLSMSFGLWKTKVKMDYDGSHARVTIKTFGNVYSISETEMPKSKYLKLLDYISFCNDNGFKCPLSEKKEGLVSNYHALSMEVVFKKILEGKKIYFVSGGKYVIGDKLEFTVPYEQIPLYVSLNGLFLPLKVMVAHNFLFFKNSMKIDILWMVLREKNTYRSKLKHVNNTSYRKYRSDLREIIEWAGLPKLLNMTEMMKRSKACSKAIEAGEDGIEIHLEDSPKVEGAKKAKPLVDENKVLNSNVNLDHISGVFNLDRELSMHLGGEAPAIRRVRVNDCSKVKAKNLVGVTVLTLNGDSAVKDFDEAIKIVNEVKISVNELNREKYSAILKKGKKAMANVSTLSKMEIALEKSKSIKDEVRREKVMREISRSGLSRGPNHPDLKGVREITSEENGSKIKKSLEFLRGLSSRMKDIDSDLYKKVPLENYFKPIEDLIDDNPVFLRAPTHNFGVERVPEKKELSLLKKWSNILKRTKKEKEKEREDGKLPKGNSGKEKNPSDSFNNKGKSRKPQVGAAKEIMIERAKKIYSYYSALRSFRLSTNKIGNFNHKGSWGEDEISFWGLRLKRNAGKMGGGGMTRSLQILDGDKMEKSKGFLELFIEVKRVLESGIKNASDALRIIDQYNNT